MRDLYQVLEVPEDADDSQLKKAYRKSALQWHPGVLPPQSAVSCIVSGAAGPEWSVSGCADKNQDRLEEADVRFKEIQNAYEILSDKHERSWCGPCPRLARGSGSPASAACL